MITFLIDLVELTHLKDYLSHYLDAIRDVYITVLEQAKKECDFVLDGTLSVDKLELQLVKAVNDKLKTETTK